MEDLAITYSLLNINTLLKIEVIPGSRKIDNHTDGKEHQTFKVFFTLIL
jgi:hypothetical protein